MSVTFATKRVTTDEFKIHLAIPPENPTMRGYITVRANVRSKAALKDLANAVQDDEYEDDIAVLKDMYAGIEGLGNEDGPLTGEAVWDFLINDPTGAYIVPALIEAYFDQYQQARRGNSKRRRSR